MLGRVLIYGLAFGSASAAQTYLHYVNGLYASRNAAFGISILVGILITGVACFMFIRSLSQAEPGVKLGKALFGSMLVCLLISAGAILSYGLVLGGMPAVKQDLLNKTEALVKKSIDAKNELAAEERPAELARRMEQYEENMSAGNFGKSQVQMNLSIGLVLSLILFLYKYRHEPTEPAT